MNHAGRVVVLDKGELVQDDNRKSALDSAVIKRVWGVDCEWIGNKGAMALVSRSWEVSQWLSYETLAACHSWLM
ncbi:hypothetical protein HKD42_06640 [Altererythrobacter sp. RZ02]|uniref:Uncharacterized protein n=1 Tax=Pontixanthobacter rizhaonensis TaxID=2730337 RepID=A0A848QM30_9SPHN|nr:hypothetical protein [Pontixanthobacter rizhaonensis]NMW31733.1 hypothetical protein [Pontixanthobacter rizhaonensis]